MKLTVGTYNIQHGNIYPEVKKGGHANSVDPAAEFISGAKLDICGLNEIISAPDSELYGDQPERIAQNLGYHHVFARAIDAYGGAYGNALVTRFPVLNSRSVPIYIPRDQRQFTDGYYEARTLLIADLMAGNSPITVMCCHFGINEDERVLAVQTVLKESNENPYPIILMGDFNLCPNTANYDLLAVGFHDTAIGLGDNLFSFPSDAPVCKIDYIFTSPHFETTDFLIPDVQFYDHRPVIATVELK